ncbi:Cell division cycle and apoptosis regulator protein 1 [Eumeta japonica]|uniref:Cell division cycle and apoptosis regulator protein 1 n=1 Tax=Eumeta variegata TaxID=151549 RepID=A0A4C1VH94_EUMVA|nr:Cell division cycle and apoptosis regulator protein 1 [Eumeta japonica]
MQSGAKNPPWARSTVNSNISGMNPQIMDHNAMAMTQQGMMPFQQQQPVFNPNMIQAQGGIAMPMAGQMQMNQIAQGQMYPGNVVAYPTPRAINPGMYQNAQNSQSPSGNVEQRVFTGTVTKCHNDFGFVDNDVFFQTSVCAKGIIPKVNDRVLVEATYNTSMPFKWNATRVQVLPKSTTQNKSAPIKSSTYNAVPPPMNKKPLPNRRDDRPMRRDERKRSRTRSRSRSRDRRDSRTRRDSPPRKRPIPQPQSPPVKYVVRVPRLPLDINFLDVPALSQRYGNLYVPSDFFSAQIRWGDTFPPQCPLSLNNPCAYHLMSRDVENPLPNDTVLEPPDADYKFSAKVMLISLPTLETFYQKCGLTKSDEKDKDKRSGQKSPLHPTRLIKFLVGHKGKGGENFAIGGPWSPSLDGENPESDPTVLVKTAIRTCKALTGIDLSPCTQWYRMVEFYYWRENGPTKSRLECVVLFLPDVWSAQPSRINWASIQERYKAACEAALRKLDGEETPPPPAVNAPAAVAHTLLDDSQIDKEDDATITIDENDDEDRVAPEPTHYSKIDLRSIKVDQLKQELRARNASCRGSRPQLMSRLSKILKIEGLKETNPTESIEIDDEEPEIMDITNSEELEDKKEDKTDLKQDTKSENSDKNDKEQKGDKDKKEDDKKLEKDRATVKARYELPNSPHIIVHPLASAKGGKFNCNVATLSLLLDYRITDNKEHSFELFVFAELFNEMLMRDFGFYIYKTLYTLPEKAEEIDKKDKQEDKKSDKKDETKDKKDEKLDKKDDKTEKREEKLEKKDKDDKREERKDSRRRDRKDSASDDERSDSPRRKVQSRGVDLPPDPYLLLSLVYFDTTRVGYMIKKDLQSLFMSLGLYLSRSQVHTILEKVCVKDSFNYKCLVQAIHNISCGTAEVIQDLSLDTAIVSNEISELENVIANGNRHLVPVFDKKKSGTAEQAEASYKDVSETGIVMYKSRLVDVGATLAALTRSETQRVRLEAAVSEARAVARTMRAAAAATQAASGRAQAQVASLQAQLATAKGRIASITTSARIFHSTLKNIQTKAESVVSIKFEEEEDVVEVVNGAEISEEIKKKEPSKERNVECTKGKDNTNEKYDQEKNSDQPTDENKEHNNDVLLPENMEIDDKE